MSELDRPFKVPSRKTEDLVNEVGKMPFGSLIGNILSACVDAQTYAANTAWKYTQKVLEQEDPIVFNFQDEEGMKSLSVPLFTIVPLPYLKLDNIDINFDAEASTDTSKSEEFLITVNNEVTEGETTNIAKGRSNLHIDINAGTTDMPVGLSMLLQYMGGGLVVEDDPKYAAEKARKEEERLRKEAEERRRKEEEARIKAEEEKKKKEAEEKKRKEEEARIRAEEERKRKEAEERKRKEEEERRKKEEEERLRKEQEARIKAEEERKKTFFAPSSLKEIDNPAHWKGAKLECIHTIWSKPVADMVGLANYKLEDWELLPTVYSTLCWRRYNGTVKLYTDKIALRYLNKMEMTNLWNGGIDTTVLGNIPNTIDNQIYHNCAKIFVLAARRNAGKFVMFDTDKYLTGSIHPILTEKASPIISTMRMATMNPRYIPYDQLKISSSYQTKSGWTVNEFNTTSPYANDTAYYDTTNSKCVQFIDYYTRAATNFMENNKQKVSDPNALMYVAEDRIYGIFISKTISTIPIFGGSISSFGVRDCKGNATATSILCKNAARLIVQDFSQVRLSDPVEEILQKYCKR